MVCGVRQNLYVFSLYYKPDLVGQSKVKRCLRYGNWGRMQVILNGEPLREVDCFKYLESQVAADGGCERDVVIRMNEGYRAWGALKSVLSNRGLG